MGIGAHWSPPTLNKYTILLLCSQPAHLLLHPVKRKKGNLAWESVSFLSFYFPISLPGKISIEFHLCDAFYRPLATVWCKMDKLIKGIGWQTHKTYLYTLEPTHKDLLPSSSFESPPSKEVTFLGGHISMHFKVRRAFLRHRK